MFGGLDRFFHNRKRKAASRIIARTIDSVRDSEDRNQSYMDILSFASLYLKKELTPENYNRVKESILDLQAHAVYLFYQYNCDKMPFGILRHDAQSH